MCSCHLLLPDEGGDKPCNFSSPTFVSPTIVSKVSSILTKLEFPKIALENA